ncbi:kunitz-like toxin PcKuz2 [Anolis carolinensis]|uniref:kunitz-like toxin PcKuz2 n=1 Tax=Anolis carolinensis TaxID=28377 RepID=UPI002F2B8BD9
MGLRTPVVVLGFLIMWETLPMASGDLGVCMLPPDSGVCFILQERWYYDFHKKRCLPFTWGGCKANENNFVNRATCMEACGRYG